MTEIASQNNGKIKNWKRKIRQYRKNLISILESEMYLFRLYIMENKKMKLRTGEEHKVCVFLVGQKFKSNGFIQWRNWGVSLGVISLPSSKKFSFLCGFKKECILVVLPHFSFRSAIEKFYHVSILLNINISIRAAQIIQKNHSKVIFFPVTMQITVVWFRGVLLQVFLQLS